MNETDFNPSAFSKIIADSPDLIRPGDLDRLAYACRREHREALSKWLNEQRPELTARIALAMAEADEE